MEPMALPTHKVVPTGQLAASNGETAPVRICVLLNSSGARPRRLASAHRAVTSEACQAAARGKLEIVRLQADTTQTPLKSSPAGTTVNTTLIAFPNDAVLVGVTQQARLDCFSGRGLTSDVLPAVGVAAAAHLGTKRQEGHGPSCPGTPGAATPVCVPTTPPPRVLADPGLASQRHFPLPPASAQVALVPTKKAPTDWAGSTLSSFNSAGLQRTTWHGTSDAPQICVLRDTISALTKCSIGPVDAGPGSIPRLQSSGQITLQLYALSEKAPSACVLRYCSAAPARRLIARLVRMQQHQPSICPLRRRIRPVLQTPPSAPLQPEQTPISEVVQIRSLSARQRIVEAAPALPVADVAETASVADAPKSTEPEAVSPPLIAQSEVARKEAAAALPTCAVVTIRSGDRDSGRCVSA